MSKVEKFNQLLAGPGVMVLVNLHKEGITGLPSRVVAGKSSIALAYGYNLARPTDDAVADDTGIRASLIFGSDVVDVFIPWAAVLSMSSVADGYDPKSVGNVSFKTKLRLV